MNRERELKYAAQSSEPPRLPRGWSLGPERSVAEIVDTYLDHAATLITRGWALRRRETVGAPTRYTLKRNAQQVGAFHQRDEIEREGDQIPAEIVLSYELGTAKPDPAIFAIATERAGVAPEAIFFCDDIPLHVAAAQAAGWSAECFSSAVAIADCLALRGLNLGL